MRTHSVPSCLSCTFVLVLLHSLQVVNCHTRAYSLCSVSASLAAEARSKPLRLVGGHQEAKPASPRLDHLNEPSTSSGSEAGDGQPTRTGYDDSEDTSSGAEAEDGQTTRTGSHHFDDSSKGSEVEIACQPLSMDLKEYTGVGRISIEETLGFGTGDIRPGICQNASGAAEQRNAPHPLQIEPQNVRNSSSKVDKVPAASSESRAADSSHDSAEESVSYEVTRKKRRAVVQSGPSNIKRAVYCDTRPNICKEFAETGQCKYGDTCIFAHDRTRYIDDWIEKATEAAKAARKRAVAEFPRDCFICKQRYVEPVYTLCEHFFCYACIHQEAEKEGGGKCPQCHEGLMGVINMATDLNRALEDIDQQADNDQEKDPRKLAYQQELDMLGF